MDDRRERGIAAFASQLGLPEEEVVWPHLRLLEVAREELAGLPPE
jgi:hypothetical protein